MAFDPAFRSGRRVSYKFLHYSECACSVGLDAPGRSGEFGGSRSADVIRIFVFFKRSDISSALLIKRIVALPGETFEMRGGRVFINGEELREDYVSEFSSEDIAPITLPDDAYIILGDDRLNSSDSRAWDDPFVRRGDIKAKALFVYLPRFSSLG